MSPTFEYIAYYIEGSGEKIFDNLKVKVQQQRNKVANDKFLNVIETFK